MKNANSRMEGTIIFAALALVFLLIPSVSLAVQEDSDDTSESGVVVDDVDSGEIKTQWQGAYFYFDAEDGIIGDELPHHQSSGGPNFCQPECSGHGTRATYQSVGGAPQGNQYFRWETFKYIGIHTGSVSATVLTDSEAGWNAGEVNMHKVYNLIDGSNSASPGITSSTDTTATMNSLVSGIDNFWENGDNYSISQIDHYTEIKDNNVFPITDILGKTFYAAFYFKIQRKNSEDVFHESGTYESYNKFFEVRGNGLRWIFGSGQYIACGSNGYSIPTIPANNDHYFTIASGVYGVENGYFKPNQNGYNCTNPIQLEYDKWQSVVLRWDVTCDDTGTREIWINGIKYVEFENRTTTQDCSPDITHMIIGGTLAQPAYDAPSHYNQFDALMLTDDWQDIVDGGYLSDPEANNVPIRSNPQPNGTLDAGTTTTNISLTTDKQAICRYSNVSNTNYTGMEYNFTYTNSTNHSTPVTGLENGKTYTLYVRCNSSDGYVNEDEFNISFSVEGHKADLNDDGIINMPELIAYIARWKASDGVTKQEVEEARDIWFTGGVY